MTDEQKLALHEALSRAAETNTNRVAFTAQDLSRAVYLAEPGLMEAIRDEVYMSYLGRHAGHFVRRTIERAESRQGWLDLPQFQHIPERLEVNGVFKKTGDLTLVEYRESRLALKAKLKGYELPRNSAEKQKREKRTLKEMFRLERELTPYFLQHHDLNIATASELHKMHLAKPRSVANRTIAKKAAEAKWALT